MTVGCDLYGCLEKCYYCRTKIDMALEKCYNQKKGDCNDD